MTSTLTEKDLEIAWLSRHHAYLQHLLGFLNAEIDEIHHISSKEFLARTNIMLDVGAIKTLYGRHDVLTESKENSVG